MARHGKPGTENVEDSEEEILKIVANNQQSVDGGYPVFADKATSKDYECDLEKGGGGQQPPCGGPESSLPDDTSVVEAPPPRLQLRRGTPLASQPGAFHISGFGVPTRNNIPSSDREQSSNNGRPSMLQQEDPPLLNATLVSSEDVDTPTISPRLQSIPPEVFQATPLDQPSQGQEKVVEPPKTKELVKYRLLFLCFIVIIIGLGTGLAVAGLQKSSASSTNSAAAATLEDTGDLSSDYQDSGYDTEDLEYSDAPSLYPSMSPSMSPTYFPSTSSIADITPEPTNEPPPRPTPPPTRSPTLAPSTSPTSRPTQPPTSESPISTEESPETNDDDDHEDDDDDNPED